MIVRQLIAGVVYSLVAIYDAVAGQWFALAWDQQLNTVLRSQAGYSSGDEAEEAGRSWLRARFGETGANDER